MRFFWFMTVYVLSALFHYVFITWLFESMQKRQMDLYECMVFLVSIYIVALLLLYGYTQKQENKQNTCTRVLFVRVCERGDRVWLWFNSPKVVFYRAQIHHC